MGKQEHDDVAKQLDRGAGELEGHQVPAEVAGHPNLPDGLVGGALDVEGDDTGRAERALEDDDKDATPPERRGGAVALRSQDLDPLHQDGGLEERENDLIECADQEDVLEGEKCKSVDAWIIAPSRQYYSKG